MLKEVKELRHQGLGFFKHLKVKLLLSLAYLIEGECEILFVVTGYLVVEQLSVELDVEVEELLEFGEVDEASPFVIDLQEGVEILF